MKIPYFFETDMPTNIRKEYLDSKEFKEDLILQNIRRVKLLAIIIIAIEMIFLLIDIISCFLKVNKSFSFYSYMVMYLIMIAINLTYLLLIENFCQKRISLRAMDTLTVVFLTLIMIWGSVISLMDQKLYGHLMTYMVNMIVCSIIYFIDAKRMIIPYLTSTLILAIGLPFFQNSSNIIIGHYLNMTVFVVISWTASRIIYRNYCDNYVIKQLMNQSNLLLEKEIEENKIINKKLKNINAQLKKLALLDELTGLLNRRGFREFIDRMLQNKSELILSVIMIDVDNFKLYNDSYGHEKGDLTLIEVAKQINSLIENTEQIAIRWGGEEFIYAAFNKSQEDIIKIANSIRLKVMNLEIPNERSSTSLYITISLGTCTGTLVSAKDISGIIDTADQALYLAKSNGRNCVATLTYNKPSDV
ncbi:MAG: GGDEF domain-containing protein [Sedimentibacter sp.]|uniref:GGDEF domain-containing protein n=1 Tax=Sedimentibacter sp. TaxID=1960295 RepID=UPI00298187CD|nr:GGDEF domain-containing protein [Sedimentibacter sp.]MDW5300304.1 GGDEF domain-containing protein [Sedimentibacter sp.]